MRRSNATHLLLLALSLAMLAAQPARPTHAAPLPPAAIVYIAPDGDDTRDCTTPTTRCATLQRALDALAVGGEARVATGVYTGITDLKRSAIISGGYALPDYLPSTGASILDGRRLGTTLRIAEPISVRLARLTITGGQADSAGKSTGRGGGIYISGAQVLLDHVQVSDNIADTGGSGRGGGIYISDGSLTLSSSAVTSNTASLLLADKSTTASNTVVPLALSATGSGGGIYAQNARVTIRQSVVSANHAVLGSAKFIVARGWGGAIYATGCTLDSFEAVFHGNDALGIAGGGGAIKVFDSQTRLRGGEISGNQTIDRGSGAGSGALDIFGGATTLDNLALRAGGVSSVGILLQPAAVVSPSAALTLTNVLLAEYSGTALALVPNGVGHAHAELRHLTVVSNGVGLQIGAGQTAHIINSVIAQNGIGTQTLNGTIALDYTDRYGNRRDAEGEVLLGPAGGLALPPQFAASDPSYHLALVSPLLDQGIPIPGIVSDFEGQARSVDGNGDGQARPDLGWDELVRSAAQFGADKTLYALPGQTIATTLELQNVGPAADIFRISIAAPESWVASVAPTVAALGPRTRIALNVTIGVPARIPFNSMAIITIRATGHTSAAVGQILVGVGEP
jgi:hypothetical protein